MCILNNIAGHEDLLRLTEEQRIQLCDEIRDFLISNVSKTGGHLASNLGVVELTVALETVYNTSQDRLVFDVGHQSYVHKLLTGRQADFAHLRQLGGIAGFPKPSESDSDAFVAGHASSSVSIALGMARARTLTGGNYHVAAVIGDGAATGGMAYEGMNDAAVSNEPLVVILNDNAMSIDRNVGGMASHLSVLRTKEKYLGMKHIYKQMLEHVPGGQAIYRLTRNIKDRIKRALIPTTIFENMGLSYFGPVDGHDVNSLITLLRNAKEMNRPVLVHVMTKKGQGYAPAENSPSRFHGVGTFDPETGVVNSSNVPTFSGAFGDALCELAQQNPKVCAITAAMPGGTGLLEFKKHFPQRLFDVGIAEEHAVSMAGGLAKQGMVPVVALYSTFLQRSYDMILQDIAMLKLHVVLAVDRAGLVGEDGETHHGVFDVGFLRQVPGLTVLCPVSRQELKDMLFWAVNEQNGPVAIRYPRGGDTEYTLSDWNGDPDAVKWHCRGKDAVLVSYGPMLQCAMEAAQCLEKKGLNVGVLRLMCVSQLSDQNVTALCRESSQIFVIEEVCDGSAIVERIAYQMQLQQLHGYVRGINLGQRFVTHGSVTELRRVYGLDADGICEFVLEALHSES